MELIVDKCFLTGAPLSKDNLKESHSLTIKYYTKITGLVEVSHMVYYPNKERPLIKINEDLAYIIIGVCRNRNENDLPPIKITTEFILSEYKKEIYPMDFDEKKLHFLEYLFRKEEKGEYDIRLQTSSDYSIAYSNPNEFKRLLDSLIEDGLIKVDTSRPLTSAGNHLYSGINLTTTGRGLFKKSMFSDLSQPIKNNNIYIQGDVLGSNIQQDTSLSRQNITTTYNSNELNEFLADLKNAIEKIGLTLDEQKEILSEIATIESQQKSPKPKYPIIKETLKSIKSILISKASNFIVSRLVSRAEFFIQTLKNHIIK